MTEYKVEDETKDKRLQLASFVLQDLAAYTNLGGGSGDNPWSPQDVDKLEFDGDFTKLIKACRFFYRKDPIVSSTLNKLVEIGINKIKFNKNGLSDNEFRIFLAIGPKLEEFAEIMALEYLISGLVVPEVKYATASKVELNSLGIKKYNGLTLPQSMFIRNPELIKIKGGFTNDPSYFVKIPDDIIFFIKSGGKYEDGTEDRKAYEKLASLYPDFVLAVKAGKTEILIEENTDLIIRRKVQPGDPYPIPYLTAALESLKHKRNLRRMDYSIAARVIGAIQLFRMGDKDFPVTEEDQESQFGSVRDQMLWRDTSGKNVERIFQLFANHTLQIDWIMPDTQALLNEQKYESVNADIIYALGFPRILITGESEKSGTSDPEYAMMSPTRTMENFRRKIIEVVRKIVDRVAEENHLKTSPTVEFEPLTMFDYQTLLKSLADLYAGKNISRTTYAKVLGYNWADETDLMEQEQKVLEEKELGEFAPLPNGVQPGVPGANPNNPNNNGNAPKNSKPSNVKKNSNNRDGEN